MTEDERIDAAIECMADYLDESELELGAKIEAVSAILSALMMDLDDEGFDHVVDELCEGMKQAREEYEGVTIQ